MLALIFYIKDVKYTIKCKKIREIAPLVLLKAVPHTPDFFAGYFNYRGTIVPVIDLSQLIEKSPCPRRLSTRIILADYKGANGNAYTLGIMAERVTETVAKAKEAFVTPGILSEDAPYLGGIVMEQDEMIQYIDLELLPDCINLLPMTQDGETDDAPQD